LLDFYAMTELIWDGKYVDGKRQSAVRVALPFRTTKRPTFCGWRA
jgi:hypothetical protein